MFYHIKYNGNQALVRTLVSFSLETRLPLDYHIITGFELIKDHSCDNWNISSKHSLECFFVKVATSVLILMRDLPEILSY